MLILHGTADKTVDIKQSELFAAALKKEFPPKVAARYQGACVILIDDVITTGSTVSECARMLVAAGIGEVRAAAIARG